jgi:hypothetical protein
VDVFAGGVDAASAKSFEYVFLAWLTEDSRYSGWSVLSCSSRAASAERIRGHGPLDAGGPGRARATSTGVPPGAGRDDVGRRD